MSRTMNLLLAATVICLACLVVGCGQGSAPQGMRASVAPIMTTDDPPPTPTPVPYPAYADQVVSLFIMIYSGSPENYAIIPRLLDSAYSKVGTQVLTCGFSRMRQNYGPVLYGTIGQPLIIGQPIISNTVASVTVQMLTIAGSSKPTFYLEQEQDEWKIDRITSWFGRDISPDNPVGEIQSCLQATPIVNQPAR